MTRRGDRAAVVAVGMAACAACCAAPTLGVLAAIGLTTTVAAVAVFGAAGSLIALITAAGLAVLRRRRGATADTGATSRAPSPAGRCVVALSVTSCDEWIDANEAGRRSVAGPP
jgi:hypothetical protein